MLTRARQLALSADQDFYKKLMERCKFMRQDDKQGLPWLSELEPGTGFNGDACRA